MHLSIILPTTGRPSFNKAVQSVLQQTNSDWELKVVQDGCDVLVPTDARISTIKGQWGSGMGSRNAAISSCSGEWTGFLDEDDMLTNNYVETVLTETSDCEEDILVFKMMFASNKVPNRREGEVLWEDPVLRRGNVGISFVVKTLWLKKFPFPKPRPAEDFHLLKKLTQSGAKIGFREDVLYLIRPYGNQL